MEIIEKLLAFDYHTRLSSMELYFLLLKTNEFVIGKSEFENFQILQKSFINKISL